MSLTTRLLSRFLLSLSLILSTAVGQVQQSAPFHETGDAIVVDATANQLWRFMDLNLDGDWNDAGEIVFYFVSAPGVSLGNPTNVAVGPEGAVYVSDSTNDQIVRLQDLDGDGVATGAGEATVFFSAAANLSGVTMPSALGLTVSADGAVWVANSNTSTVGTDSVIRLFDGDDSDAQDAGEALEYATFAVGQSAGVSIPSNVAIGADGAVYCLDNGTLGKGIYRLHDDVTPNGVCTDAGEVTAFYLPAAPAPTPAQQCWGLASDGNGNLWVAETAFDRILRVADLDSSLSIANASGEEATFYTALAAPSNMWTGAVASNGSVFVVEDGGTGAGERIFRLTDLDANGDATGASESATVYDDTLASVNLGSIRSIAFLKAPFIRATPNPIPIGGLVTLSVEAGAYDLVNVWGSLVAASVPVPPYGNVGISIVNPALSFELIPVFPLASNGGFSLSSPVPSDPLLLLATFHLQAIGGPPARLQLSNVEVITFM